VARENVSFSLSHKNLSNNRWMFLTGRTLSNTTGYKIPRPATIVSITIQTQTNTTCDFKIKKNGNTDVTSISLTNEDSKVINNLNEQINENDWIQALLEISSGNVVDYPVLLVEVAWR